MRMFKKTVLQVAWCDLSAGSFSHFTNDASRLFPATRHIVNERPIDIRAAEADGIEEEVGIRDKVLLVD